ncbi:hypothetical protein [Baekduia sp.]|jgi:hypothetical protein|uniref:hypothetical protein n=1 Tax=Baekduia sp. TaxID=2600305 RepID=UPI002E02817F|nr:hypothetical protein [Baekduia sp.]
MRARSHTPIDDLRLAIDCMPLRTREAMLEGIRTNEIIVGAYSDRAGGVCPMLAAHRHGGRTSFVSFAHAWDRFAGAKRARRASVRELRVLEDQLEASILNAADLGAAIADHQAIARDRRTREARRTGLGWLTDRRAAADAERALSEAERRRQLVSR